jgi:hypothetical protein
MGAGIPPCPLALGAGCGFPPLPFARGSLALRLDPGAAGASLLCSLHLKQAHVRRLLLLVERHDGQNAEASAAAEEEFLTGLDHARVSGLAYVGAVLEMQPVPQRSSVSGAGRRDRGYQ